MQQQTLERTYSHTPTRIHINKCHVLVAKVFLFLLHIPTHLLYIGLYCNVTTQNIVFTALFIPNNYTYFDLL